MSDNLHKQPVPSESDQDEDNPSHDTVGNRFLFFQVMPSWLTSFIIHLVLIILLAIFTFDIPEKVLVSLLSGEAPEDVASFESVSFDSAEATHDLNQNTEVDIPDEMEVTDVLSETDLVSETFTESFNFTEESTDEADSSDMEANSSSGLLAATAASLSGRKAGQREKTAAQNGASSLSENAVKLAMKWIADHQLQDGSWSFDHRVGPGNHRTSPNPGDFTDSPRAATAMALLVFLGAGQTHLEGDYIDTVDRGLAFLVSNPVAKTRNGWGWDEDLGLMYSHGLVAIALCEAYAMTNDVRLLESAKQSMRYIEFAQDPHGGGWRYLPRTRGDLSITGWQIMAIKSAHMCGLEIDADVIRKTRQFLNFMSSESGAFYGYTDPSDERRKGMTAVGLLCQMYMGWTKENPALGTGVKWLGERGPEVGDWKPGTKIAEDQKGNFRSGMYYNYYATQVMSHYGDEKWTKWNEEMRDFLVATQSTEGAAKGSWFFQDPDELGYIHGGRLYATTLAAMTLEVYYRYLPLYNTNQTSSSEFELE